MDWEKVIAIILEAVCTIIITVFIPTIVKNLTSKIQNEAINSTLERISDLVCRCVSETNQTYVDGLKKEGKFDEEHQRIAFQKTKTKILDMINTDAMDIIRSSFGNLDSWISAAIEAEVRAQKMDELEVEKE